LYVPFRGGAISTPANSSLGVNYLIRVTGDARIASADWCYEFDFTSDNGGWATFVINTIAPGQYLGAQGWGCTFDNDPTFGNDNRAYIEFTHSGDFTFTSIETDYVATAGGALREVAIHSGPVGSFEFSHSFGAYTADSNEHTLLYSTPQTVANIKLTLVTAVFGALDADAFIFKRVRIYGTGTNPFGENCDGTTGTVRGDAFYTAYQDDGEAEAYSGMDGLNQDGSGIIHANAYSPEHVYEYTAAGTGNPFIFSFTDPDAIYTDNENKNMKVEVMPL